MQPKRRHLADDVITRLCEAELPGENGPQRLSDAEIATFALLLTGAASRDERVYPDPDRFEIDRKQQVRGRLRLRHPLLPRSGAGAARGPHRLRRIARPLSALCVDESDCDGRTWRTSPASATYPSRSPSSEQEAEPRCSALEIGGALKVMHDPRRLGART